MELLLKLDESEEDEVHDFDPGELPCHLLAQYWYEALARAA